MGNEEEKKSGQSSFVVFDNAIRSSIVDSSIRDPFGKRRFSREVLYSYGKVTRSLRATLIV